MRKKKKKEKESRLKVQLQVILITTVNLDSISCITEKKEKTQDYKGNKVKK